MTSYRIPRTFMTARVVRVIAILFLVHTGADLTVPEFCGEEMGIPGFVQAQSTDIDSVAAFVTASREPKQDEPTQPTHSDEDCFCCCTHVLPGHATAPVGTAELSSAFAALKMTDLASPPLQGPYHPPRFA